MESQENGQAPATNRRKPWLAFLGNFVAPSEDVDVGPAVIPQNGYFVMGDNRNQGYDSRFWGPVPADMIGGRARIIYWSQSPGRLDVRWERLGATIE